jgi:predicted aspartyl protease
VRSRRQFAAWLAGAILSPRLARAAIVERGQDTRLPPMQDYTPPATIATMLDLFYRMTAPVKLNGQGPYAFVVDTGANQTVISQELADALALPRTDPAPLHGVAGVQIASAVRASSLDVGGRIQTDAILSVLPQAAIGAEGMLGVDGLEDQRLTLDFKDKRLRIEASRQARRDPSDVTVAAVLRSGRLTIVDASLGGVLVNAFLDSGAQRTIGNNALRALALQISPESRWATAPIISSTGQTIQGEIAILQSLRVGGLKFTNTPVAFADLHIFRLWNLMERPAILLGVDLLSRFSSVSIDFARAEVRFHLPRVTA